MNVNYYKMNMILFRKKQNHHILLYGDFMDVSQIEKYKLLGLNVSYYRRRRELTQEQLAEMVNIDRTHVGNLELARAGTSLDVIFRISDALEIPVYKLFEFRD